MSRTRETPEQALTDALKTLTPVMRSSGSAIAAPISHPTETRFEDDIKAVVLSHTPKKQTREHLFPHLVHTRYSPPPLPTDLSRAGIQYYREKTGAP